MHCVVTWPLHMLHEYRSQNRPWSNQQQHKNAQTFVEVPFLHRNSNYEATHEEYCRVIEVRECHIRCVQHSQCREEHQWKERGGHNGTGLCHPVHSHDENDISCISCLQMARGTVQHTLKVIKEHMIYRTGCTAIDSLHTRIDVLP